MGVFPVEGRKIQKDTYLLTEPITYIYICVENGLVWRMDQEFSYYR